MKKVILFNIIFLIETFAQSGFTVELHRTYCWWKSRENYDTAVETVIKYNGIPIENSNNYFYEYHLLHPDGIWRLHNSGFGMYTDASDGTQFQSGTSDPYTQLWYVIVSDLINHTFTGIISDTVSFQLLGTPALFSFHAEDIYGNIIPEVNAEHWMYPINLWSIGFNNWLTLNEVEILRSIPNLLSNSKKFWHWGEDVSDISNFNSFVFSNNNNSIIKSIYNNAYGNIQIMSLVDGYHWKVSFKDPWFVDESNSSYYLAPYGYRNLGMSAPYDISDSPLYLTLQSEHQGVLLNQDYNIPGQPYYSISIPSSINLPQNGGVHNIYLQNWDVSGASLQNANSLTTGVVFTSSSGASVTANVKATQLSNNSNAFANNSQRKLIKTPDGVMHVVYESMGRIWYETSADNGTTWQLMNGGKPLDNGASKCPAIDYSYNNVAIVYQEKSGDNSNLQIKAFLPVNGQYVYNFGTTLTSAGLYSSDANPALLAGQAVLSWWLSGKVHRT